VLEGSMVETSIELAFADQQPEAKTGGPARSR
jgi:hypothetical protein